VANAGPNSEKWICAGRHALVVAPWIGAGLDRNEAVAAFGVGHRAAAAMEIRVERRVVLVDPVRIAARAIRLPDFHQRIRDRPGVGIEDAAGDDDSLADRIARTLPGQVVVVFLEDTVAEDRARDLGE
jgi:hypothetical protein